MIEYRSDADGILPAQLVGFFEGWPEHPTPETHLEVLRRSHQVVLALDPERDQVVGFITALSDGVLSAYIPLLEVLPPYRNQGVATELVKRVVARLSSLYMIDVVCDEELLPFYERVGFRPGRSAMLRRYELRAGAPGRATA